MSFLQFFWWYTGCALIHTVIILFIKGMVSLFRHPQ